MRMLNTWKSKRVVSRIRLKQLTVRTPCLTMYPLEVSGFHADADADVRIVCRKLRFPSETVACSCDFFCTLVNRRVVGGAGSYFVSVLILQIHSNHRRRLNLWV